MAEIYLCSFRGPEGFEKEVVIKRIRSFLAKDPDFVQMFIAEARVASLLNHANIVQIFDFDKHEDSYYLAMEYVRGHSLWAVRKRSRELMIPIPPTLVAHIGAEVARGLHYAHRLSEKGRWIGLVHRDVTPHNVLVSYDGAVKLTDFGIAKAGTSLTAPGKLKGKFAYMSPEQARGEAVDARSDIFALGIVLWEMLTGGRLFDGDGDVAVLRAVQQSMIPPPARLNPEVRTELDEAVMKALNRNLEARYQSAQELERALAEYVLSRARKLEDTDTSGFLKQLFGDDPVSPFEVNRSRISLDPTGALTDALPTQIADDAPVSAGPTQADSKSAASGEPSVSNVGSISLSGPTLAPEGNPVPPPSRSWRWAILLGVGALLVPIPLLLLRLQGKISPSSALAVPPKDDLPHQAPVLDPVAAEAPKEESVTIPRAGEEPALPVSRVTEKSRPARIATLVLKVTPWAHVYIDGKNQGEVTGTRRFKVRPGKHQLRFEHPRGSEERTILVRRNQELLQEYQAFGR